MNIATLEARISASPESFRVLTGDRPTGPLHLGHYFGTLQKRSLAGTGRRPVRLIADYQVPEPGERAGAEPQPQDEIAHSRQSSVSGLMFTYPVHQAADILFCKGNLVPVGRDQLPHVEITRLIARCFAERYAPVPLGTDGSKMSKSRSNAIGISATEDETARLLKGARTDANRTRSRKRSDRAAERR